MAAAGTKVAEPEGYPEAERAAWRQLTLTDRALYRAWVGALALLPRPVVLAVLHRKARRHPDRESLERAPERLALAQPARPEGPVVWLHGIGPGDSTALLPLIRAILDLDPGVTCLVTTRTVSAQAVFTRIRESGRVQVVLAPLDTPAVMRRFLDHWRPGLAVFGEADIWPVAASMLKRRGAAVAVANAQMKGRLGRALRRSPRLARWLMSHVDLLHVFSDEEAAEARGWMRPDCTIVVRPNLKMDAPPLAVSAEAVAGVRAAWGAAPVFTCASVANAEVPVLLDAYLRARNGIPGLRLILVPRWIEQGDALETAVRAAGLTMARRSAGGLPAPEDLVLVADTYREMGTWIDLAFGVFMGHTLGGGIGHNPFEPIIQRREILSGGIPAFLRTDYSYLAALGLCHVTPDAGAIAAGMADLWRRREAGEDRFARFAADRGFSVRMAQDLLALRGRGVSGPG